MEHQKSNGRQKMEKPRTIARAMDVLNDKAGQDYKQIKDTYRGFRDASKVSLMRAKAKVVESSKHAAQTVDNAVHENAWTAIGTTAAIASIAGFVAGRKTSKRSEKHPE